MEDRAWWRPRRTGSARTRPPTTRAATSPAEELTEAQALDPIPRLATELRERGLWDDDRQEALDAEANERMDRAVEAAEASEPKPDAFFEHLYAEPTPRLRRQRDELRRHLEERGRHA